MTGGQGGINEPTLAAEGPGPPTLRGLETNKDRPGQTSRSNTPMGRWPGELVLLRIMIIKVIIIIIIIIVIRMMINIISVMIMITLVLR